VIRPAYLITGKRSSFFSCPWDPQPPRGPAGVFHGEFRETIRLNNCRFSRMVWARGIDFDPHGVSLIKAPPRFPDDEGVDLLASQAFIGLQAPWSGSGPDYGPSAPPRPGFDHDKHGRRAEVVINLAFQPFISLHRKTTSFCSPSLLQGFYLQRFPLKDGSALCAGLHSDLPKVARDISIFAAASSW